MDSVEHYRPPEGDDAADRGSARREAEAARVPSRQRAALLTLFFGSGLGFYYLGYTRRAVLWAALPTALFGLSCLLLRHVSAAAAFLLFVPGGIVTWSARLFALIDLKLVRLRVSRRVPLWQLIAFAVASLLYFSACSLLLRTEVVQAFKIPSGSMLPSMQPNDHVVIDQRAFRSALPRRGEIAAFVDPQYHQDFVKRVIGLPGDHVEVREGHAVINGWPVPYCTVAEQVEIPYSTPVQEKGRPSDQGLVMLGLRIFTSELSCRH